MAVVDRAEFRELLEKLRAREFTEEVSPELRETLTTAQNVHGDTLLHILAAEGDLEAVTTLVKLGIDVNATNNFGSVAIDTPAFGEKRDVVRYLLLNGARLDIRDSTGSTTAENLKVMGKNKMLRWMTSVVKKA
jgi:ankyrin repeat protein